MSISFRFMGNIDAADSKKQKQVNLNSTWGNIHYGKLAGILKWEWVAARN